MLSSALSRREPQSTVTQFGLYTISQCEPIHAFILSAQRQPRLVRMEFEHARLEPDRSKPALAQKSLQRRQPNEKLLGQSPEVPIGTAGFALFASVSHSTKKRDTPLLHARDVQLRRLSTGHSGHDRSAAWQAARPPIQLRARSP